MKRPTLPLGIDLGRRRIRVALIERLGGGAELTAVASRCADDDVATALADAVRELGTRERRCVIGISAPDATLRAVDFPAMSGAERRRAARFEAARVGVDGAAPAVSLSPLDGGAWALGVARADALTWRHRTAAAAGLRALAIDDAALALARVQRGVDGVIDVGAGATRFALFAQPLPYVVHVPIGGDALTEAIADALGIEPAFAEERKRTSGFAGAGETRRDALIASVVAALDAARRACNVDVHALALAGNGGRVPGLADAFARAAGIPVRLAELDPGLSTTLPADVLRAAGADWALAVGLALWAHDA